MKLVSPGVPIQSRSTISRRIKAIKILLRQTEGKISLTMDAWSSKVFKGYVAITAHWIKSDLNKVSIVLDFVSFVTPHTGDASCALLPAVINSWEIGGKMHAITTDNAIDVCGGASKLLTRFAAEVPAPPILEDYHVLCIAHVLNIAIKECIELIREEIGNILSLVNSVLTSVKRSDIFESVKIELGRAKLSVLDVETRWSSTFVMIKSAYVSCLIFNSVYNRALELSDFIITGGDWENANSIFCNFLDTAASITELQSGTTYGTLSMSRKAFFY